MKKGLYALSFGTFGLGIAEFIMMSILPDVAAGFDISYPKPVILFRLMRWVYVWERRW